ncbi:hypothetical protein CH063_00187 [Colletotrichum higginsianum]|uniref:Uncharacterized protein n=1 Tax=Colletotrichum higginsianum (strain IMI 349063) TaxID=759273 RepID=H1V407_COLHI|nr:hypothetical protein CH63R_14452 [Colletotrichum higginsianum IMI 349063]OBR02151.1 hypothetical protein CH63R_14452 [Colletotrichum higginsianum IMI 349063]CCF34959.1 hypothetical protein CH063_00187 [Colletotrichum higginsianum]
MESVRVIQPTFLVTPTDAKANLDRISELVRYCHNVFIQSGEAPYAPVIVACNRETHKALLINTKVFDPCIVPVSTLDATINVTI